MCACNELAHAVDRNAVAPTATRAACSSAAAGGMCGSMPPPLAVTISDGTWLAVTFSCAISASSRSWTAFR